MKRLALLVLVGAVAGQASAVFYSFESDLEGWEAPGWGGSAPITLSQSNEVATHGTGSLKISDWGGPNAFWWLLDGNAKGKALPELLTGTQYMFDIIIPDSSTMNWFNGKTVMQGDGLGWTEVNYSVPGAQKGVTTITIDYSGIKDKLSMDMSWFQFGLSINANGEIPDKTVYLDNFRVVPEPASMIALGAGVAALIARRRRKA